MVQAYTVIAANAKLTDSRVLLQNNAATALSCSSGTAFPTTDLEVGQLCYRTTEKKLYQLDSTGPSVWNLLHDFNKTAQYREDADARYPLKSEGAAGITFDSAANAMSATDVQGALAEAAEVLGSIRYKGSWNATTNTPTIPGAASANKGHYYDVTIAGASEVNGISVWGIGDKIVSNGSTWGKIGQSDSLSKNSNLSDLANAGTALTNLGAEPADADILKANESKTITRGFPITPENYAALSTNPAADFTKTRGAKMANDATGAIGAPTGYGEQVIILLNGASPGSPDISAFKLMDGAFSTVPNTGKTRIYIEKYDDDLANIWLAVLV